MITDLADLLRCKQLIEEKLAWGEGSTWNSSDFERLKQRIFDETRVSLSASTLRRIWGRVDYHHLPSTTTLDTLARFLGYGDWRDFLRSESASIGLPYPGKSLLTRPGTGVANGRRRGWLFSIGCIVVLVGVLALEKSHPPVPATPPYHFSSRALTRTIPNSVVFTYDASAAPANSVCIQQSWDPALRTSVDKRGTTHTAIYYEPGFYRAKLLVNGQLVREHPLLIPSDGWLATIDTKPVPIYLKPTEFIHLDKLQLPLETIQKYQVTVQPQPPLVKYFNVGNFNPVSLTNVSFSSHIKNEYNEGAAACQRAWIVLLTDDMPITIPLSTKGCVSALSLRDGNQLVSGKTVDLSAFGVDFTNWARVDCRSDGQRLNYFINGRLAYRSVLPKKARTIVGLAYGFRGTGAVKQIELCASDQLVFQAF